MDNMIGKRLDGRYSIEGLVGVGGMANVYRGTDLKTGNAIAVKVLKEEFLDNEELVRRFKNESKAISILNHPNIVKVYDVSVTDKLQYIVMEYVDGITLKEYLRQRGGTLTWKETVYFATQVLSALQHAHAKGIIHRDVKPQNIMLLADGSIKMMDFGIARFSRAQSQTVSDKAIGSVHYISPEQAKGERTDARTDIYSVGVMLYEMLSGKLPFDGDGAVSIAIMQISDKVTVLRRGQTITTVDVKDYTAQELANLMVGEKVVSKAFKKVDKSSERDALYELLNVSYNKKSKHNGLNGINLKVHAGEILGVAGVDGNGQSQLAEVLTGMAKPDEGRRIYHGEDVSGYRVIDFIEDGVAHIPEDRNKMGLVGGMNVKDNIVLKDLETKEFSKAHGKFLLKKKIADYAMKMREKYDIRCSSIDEEAKNLSGGNQQKIILARELERKPKFIVAMHPTRGLDIGATNFIHNCLIKARDEGCGVVVVSADIDEVIKISDRIIVMFEGRIMGEVSGDAPDMDKISSMMGGKEYEKNDC